MKKLLFLIPIISLCILASSLFLDQINADDCFLFEGTYVGAAVLNGKQSEPLFLVAANKHIAGFFAPEDQTHPSGASINQTSLSNGNYALSLTADDKILVKYATADTLSGKAKLIEVKNGSGAFHGYYITQDSFSSDFLNIGEDGGAVIRVTAGMDFVFSFGKINSSGKFIQVFPDHGNGPQVDITVSGATANVTVLTKDGSSQIQMQRSDVSNCTTSTTGESSSSGGTSSGEPVFVTNFMNALDDVQKAQNDFQQTEKGLQAQGLTNFKLSKYLKKAFKGIKNSLRTPSVICQIELKKRLGDLSSAITAVESDYCQLTPECSHLVFTDYISCYICPGELQQIRDKLRNSFDTLTELSKVDDDENGIPDICEQ